MKSLEQRHIEMRGALILAGLRIRHLSPHCEDEPVLEILERALRNANSFDGHDASKRRKPGLRPRHA